MWLDLTLDSRPEFLPQSGPDSPTGCPILFNLPQLDSTSAKKKKKAGLQQVLSLT